MQLTKSSCAILGLLLTHAAHATLARPGSGPQNVRLILDPQVRQGLTSKTYKTGSRIAMALAFDLPADSSCVVRAVFKPVAGTAEIANLQPLTAQGTDITSAKEASRLVNDSALGPNGKIYQLSCNQFQVGSRVALPFTFTPKAAAGTGSAVDASIEVFGGKNLSRGIGYATLVLATDDSSRLSISSSEKINRAQRDRLFQDSQYRLSESMATDELPLDLKTVPSALSVDVSGQPKDSSEK